MYFKKGEEKFENSFSKKALKLRHCFALCSSFCLVKIVPVQQAPLLPGKQRHAELERTSWVNESRPSCLSKHVALARSLLKFVRFLLKVKYVFLESEPYRESIGLAYG